ncbi:MAG: hypothetical protein ACTSUE_13810 [Promethearchaeota archaeon]
MVVEESSLAEFVHLLVQRGLGLYGKQEMATICYDSGIALMDKGEIDWLNDDHFKSVQKLVKNYATRNLPAKMTAIVLARKYGIPIPASLESKRKGKGKLKRIWKKFKR